MPCCIFFFFLLASHDNMVTRRSMTNSCFFFFLPAVSIYPYYSVDKKRANDKRVVDIYYCEITVCHRAALTLSRLYKSLWIDIRPPAGGEPTYSFASAFSLVSPWLTSSASSSIPVAQFDWPSPASIETARNGCAQPAYRAPMSSPLPAAIIQMIRYFKYEEMREGE